MFCSEVCLLPLSCCFSSEWVEIGAMFLTGFHRYEELKFQLLLLNCYL